MAITIAVTRLIRSMIDPNTNAQTMLSRLVITITRTTLLIASPADKPSAAPLVTAHSEINMPLTDTSARASNVAPNANAILGFLPDSIPTFTSSPIEGLL